MADKLSITDKIFLVILCGLLSTCFGCASHAPKVEGSNNYVAQAQQGYPCPSCGFLIPDKDVSPNIMVENKCTSCGKIFFGAPVMESVEPESQDKSHQGPKVFGRGYYSDIKHDSKFDHSVKNTWKVSPDGSSGSMSQTFIRTYEHTTQGVDGTIIGPAGLGSHGGY